MKPPAFQFYTGDWLKDPQLSMCSPSTRGIWMDLLCAMHELGRCGQVTGTVEQLCRLCRCTSAEMGAALSELDSTKTAHTSERNGNVTIVCRRMQREHKDRVLTNSRVRKYRGQDVETEVKRESNAASSSSPSTTDTHTHSARADDPSAYQRGSPSEPIVAAEANPAELPPSVEHFALAAHWEIYRVGIDLETQQRVALAVADPALWKQALDFWVDNDYRGRSIGKIVKKYRELEAERDGKANGNGAKPRSQYGGKPSPGRDFTKYPARS